MTTDLLADFTERYLATWTEPDAGRRRAVVAELWSPDGELVISSPDVTIRGVQAIAEHVGHVHDDLVAGKGLQFRYDRVVPAGAELLLRWSMLAPNGQVVGRGVDFVERMAEGHISRIHMFMGID